MDKIPPSLCDSISAFSGVNSLLLDILESVSSTDLSTTSVLGESFGKSGSVSLQKQKGLRKSMKNLAGYKVSG